MIVRSTPRATARQTRARSLVRRALFSALAGWRFLASFCLRALLFAAFALAGPFAGEAFAAEKGGGVGGWDPLISFLETIVPIAGGVGMIAGVAIYAASGPSSQGRTLGASVFGSALGGLFIGFVARDLATLFVQGI